MIVRPTLRERAVKAGIAPEYTDARGQTVKVTDDVLRKLLASIGEPESDAAFPERSLPACLVLKSAGGQVEVPLSHTTIGQTIGWRLSLEDGVVRAGTSKAVGGPTAASPPSAKRATHCKTERPFFLLPLWEKVAPTKSASDEG